MARVYNFNPGPAALPEEVLIKAQKEFVEYRNSGMSIMEMSHRSPEFQDIIDSAETALRDVMKIPANYRVLFLQGGASSQFAMVPLNLFRKSKKADYIHTGAWTKKAIPEASRYGTVNVIASSEDKNFNYIPKVDKSAFNSDADYFYICANNTIYGTRFTEFPDTGDVPLVADMSSNIMSEKVDVSKFGIIFAGAQKNLGPSGVTLVIIREDLIGHAMDITPTMFDYKTHADGGSLFNTPPTFNIYMAKLVFEWVRDMGGLDAMEKHNFSKAKVLYDALDESSMFSATVAPQDRSIMNVPFVTGNPDLDARFISEAAEKGLVGLKGHRSVGGMRASIYNAVPAKAVDALVAFIRDFEKNNS